MFTKCVNVKQFNHVIDFSIKMENLKFQVPKENQTITTRALYVLHPMNDRYMGGTKRLDRGVQVARPSLRLCLFSCQGAPWFGWVIMVMMTMRRSIGGCQADYMCLFSCQSPSINAQEWSRGRSKRPRKVCQRFCANIHDSAFLTLVGCQQDWM